MTTMLRTVRVGAPIRYSRPNESLVRRLAAAWGCTEATASQRLFAVADSPFARVAVAVRVMVRDGDHEALQRAMAEIEEAKQPTEPEALTPALWASENLRDFGEDTLQTDLLIAPSREKAAAYLRALDAQIAQSQRIRRAIVAHFGL